MIFALALLFLESSALRNQIFEHSCGHGYNCTSSDSLSYLIYELYIDNFGLDPIAIGVKMTYDLDRDDYDFQAIDLHACNEKLNSTHTHSPIEDLGYSIAIDPDESFWSDYTTVSVKSVEVPAVKSVRLSLRIEVQDDNIFGKRSSHIFIGTDIIYPDHLEYVKAAKHLEEIDDSEPKPPDDPPDDPPYDPPNPKRSHFLYVLIIVLSATAIILACGYLIYLKIKNNQESSNPYRRHGHIHWASE